MKKLSTIIIATALVLSLGQCKKQETTTGSDLPNAADGSVYITLKVGNDGSKHGVHPESGIYGFTNGDILYVGNNGHYVGTLTYANGAFSGIIAEPSTDDYLHFFFTGGKAPETDPTAGTTTSFTVNIADQGTQLPVLSYGQSTEKYTNTTATYSTILRNKCGLVKFNPLIATNNAITVSGMKTEATISFATGAEGIAPTATTGTVTLYPQSDAEKWAILLPQDAVSNPAVNISGNSYSSSTIASVPAVTANMYYTAGVDISMTPHGALSGSFTINANGDKVHFAQGNLQYTKSTSTWSFMDYQYTTVETNEQNVGADYANQDVVSLFAWGTSGWANGNHFYQPYNTINATNTYPATIGYGYGPTDGSNYTYSLTDAYANADWGVYNAISNGGNAANIWRTLTNDEWTYIKDHNTKGFSEVEGVKGVVIRPDDVTTPIASSYDADSWATEEAAGSVFLPAAGVRYTGGNGALVTNVADFGRYWSSTNSGSDKAWRMNFSIQNNNSGSMIAAIRWHGCSVRLVCPAN